MPSQNIDIHIRLDVSSPPQPTGWLDYLTLGVLSLVSLLEIFLCFYIYFRGKKYAPLRSNLNPLLYVMVACGLINSWGSLVAAKQIDSLEPIRTASCVLWHFWIEYFVGMNGVFVTLMLRVLLRAYSFHGKIKMMSIQAKKILRNWLVLIVVAPLLAVCTYATISRASYYDEEFQTCATVVYVKGLLMLWVFAAGLGIFISGAVLENGIKGDNLSERIPIRRCLIVAAFVGVACAIINTSGLMRYSIGRSLFTMLLLSIHLFMFLSLIGYKIYKGLRNDEAYACDFLNSKAIHDICFRSLAELRSTKYILADFFIYCKTMRPAHRKGDKADRMLYPHVLLNCYEAIERWKELMSMRRDSIDSTLSIKTEAIINTYVRSNASEKVCYEDKIYEDILVGKILFPENLFDDLEDYVLRELFDTWGSGYISQWNSNRSFGAYEFQNFEPEPIPKGYRHDDPIPPDPSFSDMVDDGSTSVAIKDQLSWLQERYDSLEASRKMIRNGSQSTIEEQSDFIEMNPQNNKKRAETHMDLVNNMDE